ncbi:apolipoprotein N-acyltransferase [Pedobacter yulinensis]|uniref:Apolipoprotein N-acyltransferase n=1 Tax=Pedobacter yulinensis TaxID=2126353 RepID=A0A2T3HP10_9SPHI|nr:apolipoprotein N-acyltransferase [Pedobacter yulinensis]PST84121.1 apolipoprotein N-acyltransferase [Pedobacter yulinensis]
MSTKKTYLLALLSALLLWLGWPPMPYTAPLLLFALVPLFIALENIRRRGGPKAGRQVFLHAGFTFVLWNTASIYWVYNAISAYNGPLVALPVSLIPFCLGPLLLTFAFWLHHRLQYDVRRWTGYAALICFYLALEYLQQVWDLSFPWMTLGNGLAATHQLAQWYEFTGVYGGSAWILLSNVLAFEAYRQFKQPASMRKRKFWLYLALWIIVPACLSLGRYLSYKEMGTPSNVVVVQPNVDPYQKLGSIPPWQQVELLTRLSDSVGQPNTEYFIWPETAIPNYADEAGIRENREYLQAQAFLSKYRNGTLITGIESNAHYDTKKTASAYFDPNRGTFRDNFNAAMQVENSSNVQFYHKSKLVPGVERMPFPAVFSFLDGVFAQLGGTVGGWGWQEHPAVFYAQSGIGVTPVICYESLWGDWISESVRNGAQFIAIITNDGWWGNTSGKDQHMLYAKLRAIETRRAVARSANTGISCFINQRGDVTAKSSWWKSTAIKSDILLNDQLTLYVRSGDLLAKIACLGSGVFLLVILWFKFGKKR